MGAERDDSGDAERVIGRKLCRIFQATQKKTFPNSRYHSLPASLFVDSLWTPTPADAKLSQACSGSIRYWGGIVGVDGVFVGGDEDDPARAANAPTIAPPAITPISTFLRR